MSHRKVHSRGFIPFSWEDKTRVSKSKVTHHDQCPIDIGSCALNQTLPPSNAGGSSTKIVVHDKKIPSPQCSIQLPPKRSTSVKGVKGLRWWLEDPFLAAYKECTKSVGNGKLSSDGRTNGGSKFVRKNKITFSCKNSSDVRDDNLVSLSNLPPLPKDRIHG